jgi:hypothetical protein
MENDTHITRVLRTVPEDKRVRKWRRTATGIVLVTLGSVASLGSFVVTILVIQGGGAVDKWTVALALIPFLGGLLCAVLGAHVWSGELVSAALKDIGSALRIFRRNGGAS